MRDPAFLFYDGDAAKDVSHMNRLERGAYFDLIQAQRKFGGYTVEQAKKILGRDFENVWPSLELILTIDNDVYFIEWVRISIDNRKDHAEKQRKRIQDYWDKKKSEEKESIEVPRNNRGNTLENEIENEIENVIIYLNKCTGKNFRSKSDKTKKTIIARLNEKYTFDDFKHVIDIKCLKWLNDPKMVEYLRPETLFGTKFESYLNEVPKNDLVSKNESYEEAFSL